MLSETDAKNPENLKHVISSLNRTGNRPGLEGTDNKDTSGDPASNIYNIEAKDEGEIIHSLSHSGDRSNIDTMNQTATKIDINQTVVRGDNSDNGDLAKTNLQFVDRPPDNKSNKISNLLVLDESYTSILAMNVEPDNIPDKFKLVGGLEGVLTLMKDANCEPSDQIFHDVMIMMRGDARAEMKLLAAMKQFGMKPGIRMLNGLLDNRVSAWDKNKQGIKVCTFDLLSK